MRHSVRSCAGASYVEQSATATPVERLEQRVCLDTTAPTVVAAAFIFDAFPVRQTLTIEFSENVEDSLDEADVQIQNLTTNTEVQANQFGLDFDEATNVASIRFDGSLPFHVLDDGNYRLTLPAGSVEDAAGNELAETFTFDFFFLNGDANRDRAVNLRDFNILAAHFGQEPRTFTKGDFNYDGKVRLEDFNILAARFGTELPPPAAATATAQPTFHAKALDLDSDRLAELA